MLNECDRVIYINGQSVKVPWDWLFSGGNKRLEHVCKMLLNSKVVGGPFVYQEKRYRFVDDEIVEVLRIK